MISTTTPWIEESLEAAGVKMQLVKGGSGEPLLILHDELGHPGWLNYHSTLAEQYTLYLPSHPGFGNSVRPDWILSMRDLAIWYLDAFDDLGLQRVPVIGLGLGAWLAAEIASMCPHQVSRLVLVSAPGIKPPHGEIFDMFLVVVREYLAASFLDPANTPEYQRLYSAPPTPEQAEAWEMAREQASLLTWRPYMHDLSLPYRLRRLRHVPTLIVWGQQDAIVPVSAAEAYQAAIPGSQLAVFDHCGHHPEMEQTEAFVQAVQAFLGPRQHSQC